MTVDEMPFGFVPDRGTIDAVFIIIAMQKEYNAKEKSFSCVLWT